MNPEHPIFPINVIKFGQTSTDLLDEAEQLVDQRGLNWISSQITREKEQLRKE